MRIALLGATGFVGSAILNEALDRGHTVTAVVRHAEKLPKRDKLSAIAGDVYDVAQLAKMLHGHEAIISAFNPGWKNSNLYDDQVRGTESIIAALVSAGIKRVLWVGGAGGLEVGPGVTVIDAPDFPDWVKPGSLATMNALEQLRQHPRTGMVVPCAVRATRTGGAYWSVPVGYGPASGRLKGSKQDLSSGFRRRDDQ